MLSLINIWNVARIETKTLLRSWFFRIFAGLAVIILIFWNLGTLTRVGDAPWMFRAIPAAIPYMNLLLLNVVQAAIAVFLASDFLKRDKKLDTTEVVYMRSMTNGDYVLGKSVGVLVVFLALNVLVLLVALVYNVFFSDVPVNLIAYVLYPLLISLPTLVFILGLSFLLMVIIQNQPVTFVVLLGYIALTLFFLSQKMHHLFDYMGFHIPFMYSDFIGFGDVKSLLIHRGIYFVLGLAATFATIVFIKRLPQSNAMSIFSRVAAVGFTLVGIGLGWLYLHNLNSGKAFRADLIALNDRYFDHPVVSPVKYALRVQHRGKELAVVADLTVKNNTQQPIDTYLFQLNPGFAVQTVQAGGTTLPVERKQHLLFISPQKALAPGAVDSFTVVYSGVPDERACYLDVADSTREKSYKLWLYVIKKRYAMVTPDYVLLTPEVGWYPVPGVGFSAKHPEWHRSYFANFSLSVETDPELVAISQGNVNKVGNSRYEFAPETPLPGISLTIGPYLQEGIVVDSVAYTLHFLEKHDYFRPYFSAIGDTLPSLIRDMKTDYEVDLDLTYPYKRLRLVEVPVQFYSHRRLWTEAQESVQPEIVFLPEKALYIEPADFRRMERWRERSRRWQNEDVSEVEVQSGYFRRFVRGTLLAGDPLGFMRNGNMIKAEPYFKIFPNYFTFVVRLQSKEWPVFQPAFESFLAGRVESEGGGMRFRFREGLSKEEQIHIELQNKSLQEFLTDPAKRDLIPDVVKEKGKFIFSVLESKVGIEVFEEFINNWLAQHRFQNLDVNLLLADLKRAFGLEMREVLDQWMRSKQLPGFLISRIEAYEAVDEDRTRFQVRFKVTNVEPVEGVLHISFRLGGGRGDFFMMGGPPQSDIERYIYLAGKQTKEVGIVLDGQPRVMFINTFTSRNLPSTMSQFFEEPEKLDNAVLFDGERVVEDPVVTHLPYEIIVDNESPGFQVNNPTSTSLIKRWLNRDEDADQKKYVGMSFWRPPSTWKATINSNFFGELVRSAYFTRSGDGSLKASWTAQIPESGYYEIYTYLTSRGIPRWGRGRERDRKRGEYHYIIHHDEGEEEVTLQLGQMQEGWNFLGSYYISEGEARVELTNQTKERMVVADAIKWVKR